MANINIEHHDTYIGFTFSYKHLSDNNISHEYMRNSYKIYYLLEGTLTLNIKDEEHLVSPGDLVIVSSQEKHYITNDKEDRCRVFITGFTINAIPPSQRQTIDNMNILQQSGYSIVSFNNPEQSEMQNIIENIVIEIREKRDCYEIELYGLFLKLIAFCQRRLNMRPSQHKGYARSTSERANAVAEYINQHFSEKITLDDLAEKFYVTNCYLSRNFKEKMGVSVVDYINTVRVQKAIAMFDTTNQSAAQIAKKCGFSSVSNFNRVFKRHTGNPPTFYKK